MAMIKCPECGREISDKAESCPGCGCPASEFNIEREIPMEEKFDKILIDTHREFDKHTALWGERKEIEAICERMNVDKKNAKRLLKEIWHEEAEIYRKEHPPRTSTQEFIDDFNRRQAESKIPKCPRCHSTSISYDTKKLSVGRGVVGGLVAGTPGMIMGGLSSKKGYAVCLNCGKRWKI